MKKIVLESERKLIADEIDLHEFAGSLTKRQVNTLKRKLSVSENLETIAEDISSLLAKRQRALLGGTGLSTEDNADILADDIQIITKLLLMLDESENALAAEIEEAIPTLRYIKITKYDLYKIRRYYGGLKNAPKVAHAVLYLEYNNVKLSIGYNIQNCAISFSKNGKALRHVTIGYAGITSDEDNITNFLLKQLT